MERYTHFTLTDNATGAEYVTPFTRTCGLHGATSEDLAATDRGEGVSQELAINTVTIWNHSQGIHSREFSYKLAPPVLENLT